MSFIDARGNSILAYTHPIASLYRSIGGYGLGLTPVGGHTVRRLVPSE